jgi:hypothetical protein
LILFSFHWHFDYLLYAIYHYADIDIDTLPLMILLLIDIIDYFHYYYDATLIISSLLPWYYYWLRHIIDIDYWYFDIFRHWAIYAITLTLFDYLLLMITLFHLFHWYFITPFHFIRH